MDIASACLAGIPCRYDGQAREDAHVKKLYDDGLIKPVCPECLAQLPVPRCPSEITGGDGHDVLSGTAQVLAQDGSDRTQAFIDGANKTLQEAVACGAQRAYLKSRSPSCGCGRIYDGSFTKTLRHGDGVACALLKKYGIEVIET
jgi:uncharacterized protein YbbK (DUF523 family)